MELNGAYSIDPGIFKQVSSHADDVKHALAPSARKVDASPLRSIFTRGLDGAS
jgi:hypothetical protein